MSITRKRLAPTEEARSTVRKMYGGVFGWLAGGGSLEEGVTLFEGGWAR